MRAVDRDKPKDIYYRYKTYGSGDERETIHNRAIDQCIIALNAAPTIDPESQRPRGRWIQIDNTQTHYCSECGVDFNLYAHCKNDYNYCPSCGAKMEGKFVSYDITLNDPVTKETIRVDQPHYIQGGIYAVGGTTELWLNVTYNYSKFYYRDDVFGKSGIRTIYGKTGAESIPILQRAIAALGDDVDSDYWAATEGNAKRPLTQLLAFAQMRPDGIWDGD